MTLVEISKQAKYDIPGAEKALLAFVQKNFPTLGVTGLRINASKVSLNSVNGFLTTATQEFFFKFHSEEGEEESLKNSEYYQSNLLAEAGLPVIKPLFYKTEPGSQFMIYEKINAPTAFDLFEKLEEQFQEMGRYDESLKKQLFEAEKRLLQRQCQAYLKSLKVVPSREAENAAIHQLFYNRLVGRGGATPRLELFYKGQKAFEALVDLKWVINGVSYSESLNDMVEAAKKLLNPLAEEKTPVTIGHGDCHNGNKFFINGEFVFFDPAFAGWQPALLSFVKATAHNTFLHPFWFYDPARVEPELSLDYTIKNGTITVRHNWNWPERSPLRGEILTLQIQEVWRPLLDELKQRKALPKTWKEIIRKALFCCPFLCFNLIDSQKFTPALSMLALSKCIELGASSFLDQFDIQS